MADDLRYWDGTAWVSLKGADASPTANDIEVTDSTKGLILKSPDGTRYRVTVANGGTLTITAV